jgi:hypothetical protein
MLGFIKIQRAQLHVLHVQLALFHRKSMEPMVLVYVSPVTQVDSLDQLVKLHGMGDAHTFVVFYIAHNSPFIH